MPIAYPPIDLGHALSRVKRRIDRALTCHDPARARDASAIADFLAVMSDHHEVRATQARASAVARFLEASHV
jgi:hypothetical protein